MIIEPPLKRAIAELYLKQVIYFIPKKRYVNKKIFLTIVNNTCLICGQHNIKVHKSQLGKQSNKPYKYKDGKQ
jgi:hypothetical protein